jgi:conjugative relaxase-like TrwC/TraI family protein
MLRITQSQSVHQAKSYYTLGLKQEVVGQGRYYTQEQESVGQWQGQAAGRLGLKGSIDQKTFEALCENRHPLTGESITPRTQKHRRVGYDFNFHCPKSVSVVHALTGDERILSAFQQSVAETMQEIEAEALTRVRANGADTDRKTGNLAWGEFVHFTARPVEGKPDPHLHAHCFVFNMTWDETEKRWKAVQFGNLKRNGRYYEAAFHARLSCRLAKLGYPVRHNGSFWEIETLPQSLLQKFSRRTRLIEKAAAAKGITDAEAKAALGAKTREKKTALSAKDLKAEWHSRLTSEEKAVLAAVREKARQGGYWFQEIIPGQALDYAIEHCFENASVVPEKKLLEEALRFGVGQVDVGDLQKEFEKLDFVRQQVGGETLCTTKAIVAEERVCVGFAKEGRGTCHQLNPGFCAFRKQDLSDEQKNAVLHVLRSRDRVIAIRGAAGTGKTTMMKEAVAAIEATGRKVFPFAPSAVASRGVLRQEGFARAQTVAHLLENQSLHQQIAGQVLWIDEAGLLSSRQMYGIFELASAHNCRVILSGDTAQHSPVERGDALRLLEEHAGIEAASLSVNRRQKYKGHRQAIAHLRQGRAQEGLGLLDQLKAIKEIPDDAGRYGQLAQDYTQAIGQKKQVLAVSPTRAEGEQVTGAIREALRQEMRLGINEKSIPALHDLRLSAAQRREAYRYTPGLMVQFHRNCDGFKNGEQVRVVSGTESDGVLVERPNGKQAILRLNQTRDFHVFEERNLGLAVGDRIRVTRNGKTLDGQTLSNGEIYQVKGFTKEGDIRLTNNQVLAKNYGNLTYGYCVTSHGSQGKTVDQVLIAQSRISEGAAYREQFYVSASRFRESIRIYTDSKIDLQEAIVRSGRRVAALDIVKGLRLGIENPTPRQRCWQSVFRACRERLSVLLSRKRVKQVWEAVVIQRPKILIQPAQSQSRGIRM